MHHAAVPAILSNKRPSTKPIANVPAVLMPPPPVGGELGGTLAMGLLVFVLGGDIWFIGEDGGDVGGGVRVGGSGLSGGLDA